eukprot:2844873-Rhodomonas_salina.1
MFSGWGLVHAGRRSTRLTPAAGPMPLPVGSDAVRGWAPADPRCPPSLYARLDGTGLHRPQ